MNAITELFGLTMLLLLVKLGVIVYEGWVCKNLLHVGCIAGPFDIHGGGDCVVQAELIADLKKRIDSQVVNDDVPLEKIAFWNALQPDFFAITFCYPVLMIWEFLMAAKKEFYMLSLCLYLTKALLVGQAVILLLLLISFAMFEFLYFGEVSVGLRSLWATFMSLLHDVKSSLRETAVLAQFC